MGADYASSVFVNCPFDDDYRELFKAIVFTIFDCGYVARCALEVADSGEVRIDKICRIIGECKFAVHDISRTELDDATRLPRFNMPLELGIFLGAKRFGAGMHKAKSCLVLDREKHRYQKFISDIAGQDIEAHDGKSERVVTLVRDWLRSASKRVTIPGGAEIWRRYNLFTRDLPVICRHERLSVEELTFNDYATVVSTWLRENATSS